MTSEKEIKIKENENKIDYVFDEGKYFEGNLGCNR